MNRKYQVAAILYLLLSLSLRAADFRDFIDWKSIDCTAAIQKAVDASPRTQLPLGDFRVDGTIYVSAEKEFDLGGSTLRRVGTSVAPVILAHGNFANVHHGKIITQNNSPNGIIASGPKDSTKVTNVNWVHFWNLTLDGNGKSESIGVKLTSSEPTVGGSNYNGSYSNLVIRFVGVGVEAGPICNANTFRDCFFYQITRHSYLFRGNTENTLGGGFTHLSKSIKSIMRFEACEYNLANFVQGEPGGGRYFETDEKCKHITVLGHDNCPNGPEDKGQFTTYLSHGILKLRDGTTKGKP